MDYKDILYKKYIENKINEYQLIKEIDMLNKEKDSNVIYTPLEIVNFMINSISPNMNNSIIEPSCGHGMFLFGILNYIENKFNLSSEELYSYFKNNITAIDIEENTVKELKEILVLFFKKRNINLKEDDFCNIKNEDGLFNEINRKYDIAIGNPPYIRTKNIAENYLTNIRQNFSSCKKGNVDIYYAFIEKYFNCAGKICFITPNSFIKNKSASKLREIIINNLELLIDFKEKLIFPDARTYTSIFQINKNFNSDKVHYSNDIDNSYETIEKQLIFEDNKKKEQDIYDVYSSIATLSDSTYLLKKENEKFFAINEGLFYEIEKELVIPYLKLTKQQNKTLNVDYMIFPYNEKYEIIKEDEMISKYPNAYKYLLSVKEKLMKRDKGKVEKYESWYAYGRKQGFNKIKEDEIVIVPLMIGKECQPKKINLNSLMKEYGRFIFTSGYAIPLNAENIELCNFILSEKFKNFLIKEGKPWPGKIEPYYSLTTKQLKNLFLS